MQRQLKLFVCVFGILALVFSQQKDSEYSSDIKQSIVKEFIELYGEGWHFNWSQHDTPHRILGKSISQEFDASDPILSEYVARDFISNHPSLFNIYEENLDLWVNEQHGNLRYLIFNQVYKNIPVWNGRIDFRYRLNGELVMIGHDSYPNLHVSTNPGINMDQAILYAQLHVDFDTNLNDEVIGDPELDPCLSQPRYTVPDHL